MISKGSRGKVGVFEKSTRDVLNICKTLLWSSVGGEQEEEIKREAEADLVIFQPGLCGPELSVQTVKQGFPTIIALSSSSADGLQTDADSFNAN